MKTLGLALIATLFLCHAARAQTQSEDFWISPKFDLKKAQWPKDATGNPVYGKATLDCAVGPGGFATACVVKSETPASAALEKAAPKIAALYKARTATSGRAMLDMELIYDVYPGWLKTPSFDDMELVWPRKAAAMGISGSATITCGVNLQGLMQNCFVVREIPAGRGFGEAALAIAPTFLMTPAIKNGHPVEGEVTIPVNFPTASGAALILPNALVVDTPAWSKTPSAPEILSQIDKKVGDKFADGKIVFMCELNKVSGTLSKCALANASPGMTQFRGVANALVPKFKADERTLANLRAQLDPTETRAEVMLAFSFPDMASPAWSQRYVSHLRWTRPFAAAAEAPFPEQAAKAGLTEGSALVDCLIGADGGLSNCTVVSESAPGVGLGETAKAIAESAHTNPWNDDGLPTDGARVRLPVQMAAGKPVSFGSDPTPATKP